MSKNKKKETRRKIDFYVQKNKAIYNRMRKAEQKLDRYEESIAGQMTILTSKYEGIICYLIRKLGWDGVSEQAVADWAEGKEYALVADKDEDGSLLWVPVVRKVEENEDEISDEVRKSEDGD